MPTARTEFFGIYFAERYKKHGKNQYRLQDADEPGYVRFRRLQDRNACVNEVRQCPHEHGDGERPVFDESDDRHIQIIMNGCAKLLILSSRRWIYTGQNLSGREILYKFCIGLRLIMPEGYNCSDFMVLIYIMN